MNTRIIIQSVFLSILSVFAHGTELPEGISIRVAETGDVIVTLDRGNTISVGIKDSGTRIPVYLLANIEDRLRVVQLNSNGDTPIAWEAYSDDKTEIRFMRDFSPPMILDENGNGIPDVKIERGGARYRLQEIRWAEE